MPTEEQEDNLVHHTREQYESLEQKSKEDTRGKLTAEEIQKRIDFFKAIENERTQKDLSVLKSENEFREFAIQDLVLDLVNEEKIEKNLEKKLGKELKNFPKILADRVASEKRLLDEIFGSKK